MRRASRIVPFAAGAAFALCGVALLQAATAVPKHYNPYRKLDVFAKALTYVENDYVDHVEGQTLMYGAIRGMLGTLDAHSAFMTPEQYRRLRADTEGRFGGVGIEVEIRDAQFVVVATMADSPALRAGIKAGDRIVAINGRSTKGMRMEQAIRLMRGLRSTRVTLSVQRQGISQPLTFRLLREEIKVVSVTSRLLEGRFGYLRIKNFQERTEHYLQTALKQLRRATGRRLDGLVLDLRDNPGGLLDQAVRVADLFVRDGLIVRTTGHRGKVIDEERAHPRGTHQEVRIACLVNRGSASAAEIVAGALQDHGRAKLFGVRTFGKGSVQTIIALEDGSALKLTVARYHTPEGHAIHERGIQPDVVVESRRAESPRGSSFERGDPQLRAALDYLRGRASKSARKPPRGKAEARSGGG